MNIALLFFQITLEALLARLQREWGTKIGLRSHVEDIVQRKCMVDAEGRLIWKPSGPSANL